MQKTSDYRVREVRREGKFRMVVLSEVTHEQAFVTRDKETVICHPRLRGDL